MPAQDDPRPAPHSDGYEVLGEIARGGTGVVYHAHNRALGRAVALKVLHDQFAPESAAARQFVTAARVVAQLQHSGIPPVHDLGELPDGRPFLAMRLVRGTTLDDLLRSFPDAVSDRDRLVGVVYQVCEVVGYAHAHGVVHRDLKPEHILVGAHGEVQVVGWGLALVLGPTAGAGRENPGEVAGTPAYMAPEQARGEPPDPRADVFGLGGVLCAVLTGGPPFDAPGAGEAWRQAAAGDLSGAAARLDGCGADPGLVALARRCLSPRPADRPADGGAVGSAVAACRAAAAALAREAEAVRLAARAVAVERQGKRRAQLALAAAVALLAAACLAHAFR